MTTVATIGAASSANKGAASMLQAVVDWADSRAEATRILVLTTHASADRAEPPQSAATTQVVIVPSPPLQLLLLDLPLALLSALFARVGIPRRLFARTAALRAQLNADVVADIAGISFSDGRGFPKLVYNTLMTSTPLLLGRPTIKLSQALGPFEDRTNRRLARLVLSHLDVVCPRGAGTEAHVDRLGLTNTHPAADLGFAMTLPDEACSWANAALETEGLPWVAVLPSSVVEKASAGVGIDYPTMMADFITEVLATGTHRVVIAPHSFGADLTPGHMNDRPLCRAISTLLAPSDQWTLLDESLRPTQLRALIGRCDAIATSRFHAMISALATATPVLVVGWSHKYEEVLDEFGLTEWTTDFRDASAVDIANRFAELLRTRDDIRTQINRHLPEVVARSEENFVALERVLCAQETSA